MSSWGGSPSGCPDTTQGQPQATKVSDTSRGNLLTGHRTKRPRNSTWDNRQGTRKNKVSWRVGIEANVKPCFARRDCGRVKCMCRRKRKVVGRRTQTPPPSTHIRSIAFHRLLPLLSRPSKRVRGKLQTRKSAVQRLTEAGLPKYASKHTKQRALSWPPPLSGYC